MRVGKIINDVDFFVFHQILNTTEILTVTEKTKYVLHEGENLESQTVTDPKDVNNLFYVMSTIWFSRM